MVTNIKSFMASGCYLQGPGAFSLVGERALELGRHPIIIADDFVHHLLETEIREAFARHDVNPDVLDFSGEITVPKIEDLTFLAREKGADVVVGMGGGKALDTAKGVAKRLNAAFVSVPTIVATDAPASRGLAIYNDHHQLTSVELMVRNPDCVIVDTAIIAKAPAHFFRAGIGDAISKSYEAHGCFNGTGMNKNGLRPLRSALIVADGCYALIRAHGEAAMRAVERGEVTDDVEAVVEAAVLLSCLSFENGGLSIAHAMILGLQTARGTSTSQHGEHVAYGLLVQLAVEGREERELDDLTEFYKTVGLPVQLADMGLDAPSSAEIDHLAEACSRSPHMRNVARTIDRSDIAAGIKQIESRAANACLTTRGRSLNG